jgi:hypothetical protein
MPTNRPIYANLAPLRLNITLRQDAFLRTKASELGLGKGEFLRKLIHDAMLAWSEAGVLGPLPPSRESPPSHNGAWNGDGNGSYRVR